MRAQPLPIEERPCPGDWVHLIIGYKRLGGAGAMIIKPRTDGSLRISFAVGFNDKVEGLLVSDHPVTDTCCILVDSELLVLDPERVSISSGLSWWLVREKWEDME